MSRPTVYAQTPTHLFTETLDTERLTVERDEIGGMHKDYCSFLSAVPCRIQPITSSENVQYGREANRRLVRFFVAGTTDITEWDRIIVGCKKYDIIEKADNQNAGVVMRLVCEEQVH